MFLVWTLWEQSLLTGHEWRCMVLEFVGYCLAAQIFELEKWYEWPGVIKERVARVISKNRSQTDHPICCPLGITVPYWHFTTPIIAQRIPVHTGLTATGVNTCWVAVIWLASSICSCSRLQYFLHHCLTHFSASHAAVCSYVYLNGCLVFMHMVADSSCVDFLETN